MDRAMISFAMPFSGLPAWAETLFYVAFVLIVLIWLWTFVLFLLSRRALGSAPDPDEDARDKFLWVFLVPALNEEVTIADSVSRLLAVEARNKAILVIDDGSTDGTAAVLREFDTPELEVLHRVAPQARQGKHAALNAAWRDLDQMLNSGRWSGWPRDRVIVCVVDADGRLDPSSPRFAAPHFTDGRVGGLQVLVRIYNRSRALTWCQDVEFSIFGLLYQAGRTPYGAAAMGGNGQFNRLSALDEIADEDVGGPWRARLTEDQDLGLHLIEAGWRSVADARTSVDQQGLPGFRKLLRQRTRWAQGNLQAMNTSARWRGLPVHSLYESTRSPICCNRRSKRSSGSRSSPVFSWRSSTSPTTGGAGAGGCCCSSSCSVTAGSCSAASREEPAPGREESCSAY